MRRNSGEVIKMSFSVSQSYHLRIAKTQGSTGRNCEAPPIMHGGAPNDPKTLHRDKSHQQKVFWPFLGPISYPWKSQRDHVLLVKSLFWEKRSWALQGSLVMATKPQNMLSGWVNKIHQDMEKRYLFKVENRHNWGKETQWFMKKYKNWILLGIMMMMMTIQLKCGSECRVQSAATNWLVRLRLSLVQNGMSSCTPILMHGVC